MTSDPLAPRTLALVLEGLALLKSGRPEVRDEITETMVELAATPAREMLFPPHPFELVFSEKKNAPGTWSSSLVEVRRDGERVAAYERNYPGDAEDTFAPFEVDGEWYALHSPDYTTTRVLRLSDGVDLGGEEPDAFGFCPVEYYVPRYREARDLEHPHHSRLVFCNEPEILLRRIADGLAAGAIELGPVRYCPFGLVAGCIWGDDGSLKIELVDLTGAEAGAIERRAQFGYAELPGTMDLREALRLHHLWTPEHPRIELSLTQDFDLRDPPPEA